MNSVRTFMYSFNRYYKFFHYNILQACSLTINKVWIMYGLNTDGYLPSSRDCKAEVMSAKILIESPYVRMR